MEMFGNCYLYVTALPHSIISNLKKIFLERSMGLLDENDSMFVKCLSFRESTSFNFAKPSEIFKSEQPKATS